MITKQDIEGRVAAIQRLVSVLENPEWGSEPWLDELLGLWRFAGYPVKKLNVQRLVPASLLAEARGYNEVEALWARYHALDARYHELNCYWEVVPLMQQLRTRITYVETVVLRTTAGLSGGQSATWALQEIAGAPLETAVALAALNECGRKLLALVQALREDLGAYLQA